MNAADLSEQFCSDSARFACVQYFVPQTGGTPNENQLGSRKTLCFPKIISERNGGAGQTRLGWLQRPRFVALPDLGAHPCLAPSACGPHCSTPHKKKEFVAGAPRRRSASRPGTRDARCQSDAPHKDFAKAIQARSVGRGSPSPSPAT